MKNWRDVSLAEFEAFLRDYPRPLETRPPLSQRKVNFRAWLDGSLGEWPDNAVAKAWRRGRCGALSVDRSFRDTDGQPGFSFNERDWPHGWRGAATPHGAVFTR